MNITKLISETSTLIANNYVSELNEKKPEELNEISMLFNNLTELAIHVLKESPEFRSQFARIHKEFLKYPECKEVIEESYNAVSKYQNKIQLENQSKLNRH